jgi:hypothetical protein
MRAVRILNVIAVLMFYTLAFAAEHDKRNANRFGQMVENVESER